MKSKIRILTLCGGFLALASGLASAQISVVGTQTANFGANGAGTYSIPYQVQNPNAVIVFGTYIDAGGGAPTAISFGTGVGDQVANNLFTVDRSSLSYFLNPSTSAGLSINVTAGVGDKGYVLWELSGVDLLASVQSASLNNGALQITTTAANSFITDMLGVNDFGISDVSPDAGSIQTEISQLFVVPGGGQLAAGQATTGSAGTYDLGWTVTGGSGNYGELAYAFAPAAVPEPSSMVLFGLGALIGRFIIRRKV